MDENLEFLEWFYSNCDFGPAHEDVISILHARYTRETGKNVPDCYRDEEY